MLSKWLTFAALMAGSANPEKAAITVTPTCRVKGYLEAELTLKCGDGKNTGVVQYWHTPFGDLQTLGSHSKLDPTFIHHDGSLVIPATSRVHSGLYYCLLQHTEGVTVWSYELFVNHDTQKNQGQSKEQASSCDASRIKRDVGSDTERETVLSVSQFAGAVAASVLLTFVLGFSAGALSRTHVLRCLGGVAKWLGLPQTQQCQTDVPNHGSQVSMLTLTPMYDNQAFEMEHMETTISSTASSPPAKPQRSFRTKREGEQETTAYLERCDYMEEERRIEGVVAGRSLEEKKEVYDEKTEEKIKFYLLEDGEGQTKTDENQFSKEGEETGTSEETNEWREEKEVEEDEQENCSKGGGKGNKKSEVGDIKETGEDIKRAEGEGRREDKEVENDCRATDICSRDETGSKKEEDMMKVGSGIVEGEPMSSPPLPGRRSRIIRLYHYDDDGQRYCHLPEPTPDVIGPAPRPRYRSVSLSRLSAIMAAASAGPLNAEDSPHFQMKI